MKNQKIMTYKINAKKVVMFEGDGNENIKCKMQNLKLGGENRQI